MTSLVRHLTIDCAAPHEPYLVAQFWSQVLGVPMSDQDEPGDEEALLTIAPGQPGLLFIRVPEAKSVKNRIHLDLEPDQPREQEVERLLALGATLFEDHRRPDGRGWVTLTDPAGNEFCVEASAAERASR